MTTGSLYRSATRLILGVGLISLHLASAAAERPNILVIMGDDIGITNISKYSHGMMGYQTPNIDRIANEGMMFTDYYGEQSCTAGRSAFITGQHPIRTGLTKVGIPGAPIGIQPEDPTLAELLKPLGYATGQFGKNHLGDRDEFLPTNHGFDEFFGNLYHLNAEEAPEDPAWPNDPKLAQMITPRGVIRSTADGKVEDLGPLNTTRMETIDEEFLQASLNFMEKAHNQDEPFFVWFNSTRMHYYTHIKDETRGLSGQGFYNDGMVEHDNHVGELLAKLDELGVADNTIVLYTTDNGVHYNHWPDAGITPFRGEKNTNWEGGFRVPALVRWPGKIDSNSISNDIMSHLDWVPTLMAAAGVPDVKQELLEGHEANGKTYNVHLDGYNFLPYLTGEVEEGPRNEFIYASDGGDILALRDGPWKLVFAEQRSHKFNVWSEPFVKLRIPKVFNLRQDPFERADIDSNSYQVWWDRKIQARGMATLIKVKQFLNTFREYPPRQRPATFTIDQMMEQFLNYQQ
ncbi:arylsulfatase [Marinobacter sp. M216]|uniref:Arylsulfatase n=1 Tax=Marinobacter albus TaxID=3030833 RepID=A0ABT7HEE4_9GAMM|nr:MULTISPECIES: arylsulfatase [unclassified Marinobacter]MBW7472163.1 arylsulfatase [Marinobacter sp. F4218]MDK9558733.1 arylsulfatase [Marinobacter sp. M216]